MVVVPGARVVARPEALMVATEGEVEAQVTPVVMSLVEGFFALPKVPVAVNCTVWPTFDDWLVGETATASSPWGLEHPTTAARPTINNPLSFARTNIFD